MAEVTFVAGGIFVAGEIFVVGGSFGVAANFGAVVGRGVGGIIRTGEGNLFSYFFLTIISSILHTLHPLYCYLQKSWQKL